jgi:predicted transposase YdaD
MRESVIYQSILNEGREETALKIAANMLFKGVPVESVIEFTGLTLEQLLQIQTQQGN